MFTRKFALMAAIGAGLIAASGTAFAKLDVQHSETWKPGYIADTARGGYYKLDVEQGVESLAKGDARVLRSETWKPGYVASTDGYYYKLVREGEIEGFKTAGEERRPGMTIKWSETWKPGYISSGDRGYYNIVREDAAQ